jgi:hypothetical protein
MHSYRARHFDRARQLVAAVALLCVAVVASADDKKTNQKPQPVIGWVENVGLMDAGVVHKARIDTGAGLASIDATVVKVIKSDKPKQADRVVFTIEDGKGGKKTLEKDIVEWVNIKKKGGKGFMPRPVVKMQLCIAGKKLTARVNLAERHGFLYPVLIGRNFLKMGHFLVDSKKSLTHEPDCK